MQFLKHDFSLINLLTKKTSCLPNKFRKLFNTVSIIVVMDVYEICNKKKSSQFEKEMGSNRRRSSHSPTGSLKSAWAHGIKSSLSGAQSYSQRMRPCARCLPSGFLMLHAKSSLLFLYRWPVFVAKHHSQPAFCLKKAGASKGSFFLLNYFF